MRWFIPLLLASPAFAAEIAPADLSRLPAADVVVLGEVHDNAQHHAHQAAAVAALAPKAVVWEMIPQDMAVPATWADQAELGAALEWAARGWPEFSMYYPIFAAAPKARHYGAEVGREAARKAVSDGAMAVAADGARFGLDRALPDDEQSAREAEQMQAHCDALPADLLPGMVQAQRLRDAALARAVLQALQDVGPPVAVITGSGHARKDWGLPAVLAFAAPDVTVLSVGQVESDPGPYAPFDLWLITAPAERPDPCAGFR
ncbi:ChaN family lipoprotein [Pseudotabrizicola sp. L79]|uniref:ChaN family lipoprotein n=1 Tax=Pseudotabrizicola sp. L79 TaxID=3118402 RepID=UPI002F95AA1D